MDRESEHLSGDILSMGIPEDHEEGMKITADAAGIPFERLSELGNLFRDTFINEMITSHRKQIESIIAAQDDEDKKKVLETAVQADPYAVLRKIEKQAKNKDELRVLHFLAGRMYKDICGEAFHVLEGLTDAVIEKKSFWERVSDAVGIKVRIRTEE